MGVNINEDQMIAEMEKRHFAQHGESAQTTSTRESLRKLGQKNAYYQRAYERFIHDNGEAPKSI